MPRCKLLICDLDNTLYDWCSYFVLSFYEMIDKVIEITDCDRDKLLDDFRKIHQKYHDSEHPFALLETNSILSLYKGIDRAQIAKILDPAFHAFNSARKRTLTLHKGVRSTLDIINANGVVLVAHTESKLYGVVDRLRRLGLTDYFSRIYCRERPVSNHPDPIIAQNWLKDFPMERVVELSQHQMKPDVDVLLEICAAENCHVGKAAYVGDSIARDVLMAKRAGVYAIWAAYGAKHNEEMYESLVRITHWTAEDVARERRLKKEAESVQPDFTAHENFKEILKAIDVS